MSAEESLQSGDLNKTLTELQQQVRSAPSDAKLRVFLFQLLAVMGQWDRAMTQLNVAGELDAETLAMVQAYREALHCEVFRAAVFSGERTPMIFDKPDQWLALLMESLKLAGQGNYEQCKSLRDQAFEAAPATGGTIDGQAFEWIADADNRLGPVLEALLNGRYYWIPFEKIHQIIIEKPEDLRDLVWMPAHFMWSNGGEAFGFIPTRYPGSEKSEDNQILMARRTEWMEKPGDTYQGLGQRMLATDVSEYPLMDVRHVILNTVTESGDDPGDHQGGDQTEPSVG